MYKKKIIENLRGGFPVRLEGINEDIGYISIVGIIGDIPTMTLNIYNLNTYLANFEAINENIVQIKNDIIDLVSTLNTIVSEDEEENSIIEEKPESVGEEEIIFEEESDYIGDE